VPFLYGEMFFITIVEMHSFLPNNGRQQQEKMSCVTQAEDGSRWPPG